MPDSQAPDGMQAQILIELGKLARDIAVVMERLAAIPDHENRLRDLEKTAQAAAGTRDLFSRVVSLIAAIAATGAAVVTYLHK